MVKRILIGLGIFVGLLAVALGAFFVFFPKETVRAEIERQVERATERDLTLGRVDVALWPALGLEASGVALSNPRGFTGAPFLQAERVVFAVAILPLLSGDIQIKRLILDQPQLTLSVNAQGAPNWAFPASEDEPQRLETLSVDDMRINNGRLTFQGAVGEPLLVEDIDSTISMQSLETPAEIAGSFVYLRERIELESQLGLPRAMLEQGETPLNARFTGAQVDATFTGAFNSATGAIAGRLEGGGPSLRQTLGWMGTPLAPGNGFGPYTINAAIEARGSHDDIPTRIVLTDGAYGLDAIRAQGDVTIDVSEAGRILARGTLTIPELDANPYLPAAQGEQVGAAAGVNTEAEWPTAALDLSGLNAADLDLALNVAALRFQRMRFTNAALRLGVQDGVADARLTQVSLYGGSGTAHLTARAEGNRVTTALDVRNIQAEPLLTDAIGFGKIAGSGRLVASISGAGASQAALMRSLNGTASFTFNDGQYKGVDLASVARTIQSAMSGQARGPSAATDFAELAASFQIANGVAVTQDMRMLNPFVRLDGQGIIDIGRQNIDMRIAPRAVNTIQGQGGQANIAGLGVPFRVHGPWARTQFSLALGDVVQNQLRQQMQNVLGNALGRPAQTQPQETQTGTQERPNPLESIGSLLRRN